MGVALVRGAGYLAKNGEVGVVTNIEGREIGQGGELGVAAGRADLWAGHQAGMGGEVGGVYGTEGREDGRGTKGAGPHLSHFPLQDPRKGFGIAISGGGDRTAGSVVVSDVVPGGPAAGRLQ